MIEFHTIFFEYEINVSPGVRHMVHAALWEVICSGFWKWWFSVKWNEFELLLKFAFVQPSYKYLSYKMHAIKVFRHPPSCTSLMQICSAHSAPNGLDINQSKYNGCQFCMRNIQFGPWHPFYSVLENPLVLGFVDFEVLFPVLPLKRRSASRAGRCNFCG